MARPHRSSFLASLGDAITADLDEVKFKFIHPRHIQLYEIPLKDGPQLQEGEQTPDSVPPKEAQTTVQPTDDPPLRHHQSPFEYDPDEPQIRYATETGSIQLFYDLFFVANLTSFTSHYEVTTRGLLESYIGLFALLWFTWFQVALFDIRLGFDSAFERVCQAIQFGVMVGLAVQGTYYDVDYFYNYDSAFKDLSLILMVSRLVLALQYAGACWCLRGYKKARLPLLAHSATMFISAMTFLGLSFGFVQAPGIYTLAGWYVLVAGEAGIVLFISAKTKFLNFRRTNIIERLGLLTLIILGEGIMGMTEAVSKINNADGLFSDDVIGLIICGVLIVYFLYMMYFDQTETVGRKVGTIRQTIWAIGHFPYHVSILLIVEGFGQFTIWRKIVDYVNLAFNIISGLTPPAGDNSTTTWENYASALNSSLTQRLSQLLYANYTDALTAIADSGGNPDILEAQVFNLQGIVAESAAELFGVEVPTNFNQSSLEGENALVNIVTIYTTVFLYFFICAGLALVFLACLFILGKKGQSRIEYISIGSRLLVGIGIALLTLMYVPATIDTNNVVPWDYYFVSPWLTPTVVLAYALVIALDAALVIFLKMMVRRRSTDGGDA